MTMAAMSAMYGMNPPPPIPRRYCWGGGLMGGYGGDRWMDGALQGAAPWNPGMKLRLLNFPTSNRVVNKNGVILEVGVGAGVGGGWLHVMMSHFDVTHGVFRADGDSAHW